MKPISSIVLLVGMSLFLNGQESNLIKNPGFTAGSNWWYKDKVFSIAKENGNRYFRIVSETEIKPVFAEQTPVIPVEAGKSYEFSCRFRSMLKSGEAYVMFLIRDAGNRCIRILYSPKITEKTGSKWETLRYVFVVPEKGTAVQIRLYAGMSFSGEVQFDDLVLKEGNGELKVPELPKKPELTGKPDAGFLDSALLLTDFRAFPGNGEEVSIFLP